MGPGGGSRNQGDQGGPGGLLGGRLWPYHSVTSSQNEVLLFLPEENWDCDPDI